MEEQVAKYISSLKYPIQERMILHDVFSADEAYNKAIKIKRLQNRTSHFKSVAENTSTSTRTQQSSTSGDRPPTHKAHPYSKISDDDNPTTKDKENSYTKPGVGKCYRCGEPGHKSNECPRRRRVNMADCEDEVEVKIETEPEDSDFYRITCRVSHLRGVAVIMQSKNFRHYTTTSNLLLKVFGQKQGV